MTLTSYYTVLCTCGHEGKIRFRENDTPYGSGNWESYSVQELIGGTYQGSADWSTIFNSIKPQCPKCNATLSPENLVNR